MFTPFYVQSPLGLSRKLQSFVNKTSKLNIASFPSYKKKKDSAYTNLISIDLSNMVRFDTNVRSSYAS